MRPAERVDRWAWLAARSEVLRRSLTGRLSPWEVDDVTQEALLRAATSTTGVPGGSDGARWLARVARNIGIDRWRRRRREVAIDTAAHVPALPDAAAERIDLEAALGRLSRSDRHLLELVAAGLRYDEVAKGERITVVTVRQRVARARARLLTQLKEEDR
jgi:RNA polymerase sigma-70 factor (ECF subfamily)